uniref:F-box domain-containing protein n=1 Tax=Triticum urartu TaxID=4572 RepID=A0A8R7VFR2_TRIUA
MANMVEDSQDDRLSKLPDDVLLNIVERLGIVDVARTTVLSRRWKQIPAILSKVVILAGSFEPKHEDWSKLTPDDIVRANTTVLEATRSILERRAGSLYPIHLLRMQFYLGDESILIGQTVANTIATQKVDSAEFTILTKIWVKPEGRRQLLPVFHKLRIVNWINIAEECDLTWTMFLLHGAPNLKELHILVRNHQCEMITGKRRELPVVCKEKDKGLEWEPSASDFKHHNLTELSIYGRFHAADKLVRFARDVVEAAVNLENIRLYKSPVCVRCKHMLQEWTFKETSSLSYKFNKVIPSHVRIHFPSL